MDVKVLYAKIEKLHVVVGSSLHLDEGPLNRGAWPVPSWIETGGYGWNNLCTNRKKHKEVVGSDLHLDERRQWDVTGILMDIIWRLWMKHSFHGSKNTCELLEVLSTWMSNRFMPTFVGEQACQGHMNTQTPKKKKKRKKESTTVTLLLWVCVWL
jgi:hypothetical protein